MYVYLRSETAGEDDQGSWDDLWTVGFYDPQGKWHPERDCATEEEAAERVAWLNGSRRSKP
jgi:hypothetical protein